MERRKRWRSASRGRKGGRKDDREHRLDREREKVVSEFGGEKLVVDEAERKMDKLEGAIRAEDEDVCLIYQDDADIEGKVHNTLWRHASYWKETGASEFARKGEGRKGRDEGQRVMEQKVRGRMMERVDWVKKEKE